MTDDLVDMDSLKLRRLMTLILSFTISLILSFCVALILRSFRSCRVRAGLGKRGWGQVRLHIAHLSDPLKLYLPLIGLIPHWTRLQLLVMVAERYTQFLPFWYFHDELATGRLVRSTSH